MKKLTTDVLVIGAGAAGLVCALELAPKNVMVLAKAPPGEGSSSAWAQGGIAAAVSSQDDPEQHMQDTIRVSGGIGDEQVASELCATGPNLIEKLIQWGVQFDCDASGNLALSREAAHAHRRVLHAGGDSTGAEIMRALGQAVQKADHIDLKPDLSAFHLLTKKDHVVGVLAKDQSGEAVCIDANAVVMATGGIGQLFGITTNPVESFGDGLGMAACAGAKLKDLEFIQFHPTAMDIGQTPMPLATEALRGEGAHLLDEAGNRFMLKIHPDGELAPRDVVARAIWGRVKQGQKVLLDASQSVGAAFKDKFPTVWNYCQDAGIDPAKEPIPIKPAAHYHMGGIEADVNGRTSLKGLWAVGEVACNGVHGANRLASNSLLEAVVFGQKAALNIKECHLSKPHIGPFQLPCLDGLDESQKLADVMYKACGVERSQESLLSGLRQIKQWLEQPARLNIFFENRLQLSKMILSMALQRTESRGAHFRADYPKTLSEYAHHSVMTLQQVDRYLETGTAFVTWGVQKPSWPTTKVLS